MPTKDVNFSLVSFGRAGVLDLSRVGMKRVVLHPSITFSPFHRLNPELRWLPIAALEISTGRMFVAIRPPRNGEKNGRLYFADSCEWCMGLYLASRRDARFCSDRCRLASRRENAPLRPAKDIVFTNTGQPMEDVPF